MYTQHPETLEQLVVYHQERLEASMRAVESDRAVWVAYRAKFGSFLISFGERLRGDCVRDLMPSPPSTGAVTANHAPSQCECA